MGRTAAGVKGISLSPADIVVGMVVVRREGTLLVVAAKGYGKRSAISDYRITSRGGKGIITLKTTEKVGKMIALMDVLDTDDLLICTANGHVIRERIEDIKVIGRNTQGVRLIRLNENDEVADAARVVREEETSIGEEESGKAENETPAAGKEEIAEEEKKDKTKKPEESGKYPKPKKSEGKVPVKTAKKPEKPKTAAKTAKKTTKPRAGKNQKGKSQGTRAGGEAVKSKKPAAKTKGGSKQVKTAKKQPGGGKTKKKQSK